MVTNVLGIDTVAIVLSILWLIGIILLLVACIYVVFSTLVREYFEKSHTKREKIFDYYLSEIQNVSIRSLPCLVLGHDSEQVSALEKLVSQKNVTDSALNEMIVVDLSNGQLLTDKFLKKIPSGSTIIGTHYRKPKRSLIRKIKKLSLRYTYIRSVAVVWKISMNSLVRERMIEPISKTYA